MIKRHFSQKILNLIKYHKKYIARVLYRRIILKFCLKSANWKYPLTLSLFDLLHVTELYRCLCQNLVTE